MTHPALPIPSPGPGLPHARLGLLRRTAAALLLAMLPVAVAALELPPGFVAETLATNLNAATALAPAPDGRIFIADQTGPLLVWKDGRVLDRPALNLANRLDTHWERGLIGLALSPEFPREPHLFALYVAKEPFPHHVLARFTVSGDEILPDSEKILLEGDDQAKLGGTVPAGHQGGALRFGPDGRLHVSLGEQTAGGPAQRLDSLLGKILRLNRDGSIPEDNPFHAQTTGKYRAIHARGVRNSFGIAAQPAADGGRMFFTDVGGSAFEEVNELVPGANYGWPHAEGFSTNPAFTNPLHAYPPLVGQSIVGGAFVPLDSAWPAKWRGRFLFGDFMKHWLKALDPAAPTNVLTFARGLNGPVAIEFAPDGSLLVLNRGTVWRDPKKFVAHAGSLLRIRHVGGGAAATAAAASAPAAFTPALGLPAAAAALPKRLPAAEWKARVAAASAAAFELTEQEWTPPAAASLRLFLPETGRVAVTAGGELKFPPGSVFIREFTLPLVTDPAGVAAAPRLIERRVQVVGAPVGYGASYRLDAAGDGHLIEDGELTELGQVREPRGDASTNRPAHWWFPAVDDALGEPVLNPSYRHVSAAAELSADTLAELRRRGRLDESAAPAVPGVAWTAAAAPAEARVRAYLHANCAVCHQPGGASRGNLDLRLATPLAHTGLLDAAPQAGDLGIAGANLLTPGSPEKSILLRRLRDTGFFRMPPVAFHQETSPIIPVVEEWIRSLQP